MQRGFSKDEVRRVAIHSLKATTLSWCCKFGVPRETRQILGYHSVPGIRTMLHYSRDEQAVLPRRLWEVLSVVAEGSFDPDASRSGLFK
eukprot:4217404-Amphidinium_carterae.2